MALTIAALVQLRDIRGSGVMMVNGGGKGSFGKVEMSVFWLG